MQLFNKVNVGKIADKFMPALLRPYWDSRSTSSVGYRLAHGWFWSIMGAGIPAAINMITTIVVARFLGKGHFGELGIIGSTAGMFSMVATFGLAMALIKHVAEFKKNDPAKAGRIIALFSMLAIGTAILMSGCMFVTAPWLARRILAAPYLTGLLRISIGIIFLSFINSVQMGTLVGFEAFRAIAWINSANAIVSVPLVAGGAYFFGLPGAICGMVVSLAMNCIISNIELRNEAQHVGIPIDFSGCGKELYILLEFSLPAVLAGIIAIPASWVCSAMLVNQTNGYAEMGIFSAASAWQKAILFLPQCLNTIALPMLVDFQSTEQSRQYRKAFWYNIMIIGVSALAAAVIVALASPYIMKVYGTGFSSGRYVLMIISFNAVFVAINNFIGGTLIAKGKMWFAVTVNLLWAVLMITTAYFMIPIYGALGLSLAMLISFFIQSLCMMLYIAKS